METDILQRGSSLDVIKMELLWLNKVIETRIEKHFAGIDDDALIDGIPAPDLNTDNSAYAYLLRKHQLNTAERIILLMALAVHVSPVIYDIFFIKNEHYNRGYTEFGGIISSSHSGFIPTGETVSFLLSGRNLAQRFLMLEYFSNDHVFYKHNILHLADVKEGEPVFGGALTMSKEYLSLLTQGRTYVPQYTSSFPAKKLDTSFSWQDAVYDEHTWADLEDIRGWVKYSARISENPALGKYLKKGYRVLFHGPPGTGKTMTAAILGKEAGLDVYQVDLASVVSKYIGETEKNLASVFDMAENKGWILFFDEADALFGKRIQTQSSNDQFANQQVGYLLQRIEDYNGMVVLSTNFKDNIDAAFLRRFQSVVYFPKPKQEQRLRLWEHYFHPSFEVEADLEKIASEFEITGGSMINVLRYCAIAAMRRGHQKVYAEDIYKGIHKEYQKEGVTL